MAFRPPITRSLALSALGLQFSVLVIARGMPGKKSRHLSGSAGIKSVLMLEIKGEIISEGENDLTPA